MSTEDLFWSGPSLLAAFDRPEEREVTSKLGPDQEKIRIVAKMMTKQMAG